MARIFCLLCLLAVPAASAAGVMRYAASEHDSHWEVESSPLRCVLQHQVPQFGRAVFSKEAGQELTLVLENFQRPFRSGEARLLSVPPAWRHEAAVRDLGTVDFVDGKPQFQMPRPLARRLLAELEQGMFPTVSYKDWADGRDEVNVALSSVNVRAALGEFKACLDAILPFNFQHVRFSRVHYLHGEEMPDPVDQARLDAVARYVKADESVRRIEVDGYTDNRGFRAVNLAMSEKRVQAIKDYLVAKGVSPAMVVTRAHGENKPIASNRTSTGRARNRRVEVTLVR